MRENDLKTAVQAWIRAGAEVSTGLLLLSQCSTNTRIPVMIRRNPTKYRPLLLERLCAAAGIELPRTEPAPTDRRRFRDDFPFLRDSDCPQELKILAADKITAHEHYVRAHDRLFDCTTLAECFHTAREAIVNFQENRAIFAELDYYREHRTILGKHRIFEHLRRQQQLHKLTTTSQVCHLANRRRNQKRRQTASVDRPRTAQATKATIAGRGEQTYRSIRAWPVNCSTYGKSQPAFQNKPTCRNERIAAPRNATNFRRNIFIAAHFPKHRCSTLAALSSFKKATPTTSSPAVT